MTTDNGRPNRQKATDPVSALMAQLRDTEEKARALKSALAQARRDATEKRRKEVAALVRAEGLDEAAVENWRAVMPELKRLLGLASPLGEPAPVKPGKVETADSTVSP